MDKLAHISDYTHNIKEMITNMEQWQHLDFIPVTIAYSLDKNKEPVYSEEDKNNEDTTPYQYIIDNIRLIEFAAYSLRQEMRRKKIRLKDIDYETLAAQSVAHKILKFEKK